MFDIYRFLVRRSYIRRKKYVIYSSDIIFFDEECFERRKLKSMVRVRNRCLFMNFRVEDLVSGIF